MTKYLCRDCKKEHGKKHNGILCESCEKAWKENGCKRFKVGKNTWVWVRQGTIRRAVDNGENYEPVLEGREVVE